MMQDTTYVLVTAAHNEAAYIEKTIEAVLSQTVRPARWVIVSDGSEDRTDDIVQEYAACNRFIEFARLEPGGGRTFARQVYAQQFGTQLLQDIRYDYIGMLDADISLPPDYYEEILDRCQGRPTLGIAGGTVLDKHPGGFSRPRASDNSVAGGIQMFRRQCFEDIGGYIPLERGGQDAVAEVMARMHGWEVASFSDIEVQHYRATGSEGKSICRARFLSGSEVYLLGYHPLFHLASCLRRIRERPYLLGSLLRLCGYFWSWWRRHNRQVGSEFVTYLRREQIRQLRAVWGRRNATRHPFREFINLYRYHRRHTGDDAREALIVYQRLQDRVSEYISRQHKERLSMLDVGCGKMYPFSYLASVDGHRVTAVDTQYVSPYFWKYPVMLCYDGLLVAAKAFFRDMVFGRQFRRLLCKSRGCGQRKRNPTFVRTSAERLPFPDGHFDVVFSVSAFEHILDVEAAISECARVVKPDGIIYISLHPYTSISGSHHPRWFHPDTDPPQDIPPWFHLRNANGEQCWELDYGLNGLRLSEYREAFAKHVDVVDEWSDKIEGESFLTEAVRCELQQYSTEELLTSSKTYLATKRVSCEASSQAYVRRGSCMPAT